MPIQTRSAHKKDVKGKGQSFSYQDNPFYIKGPLTDKPSSSYILVFGQPLSPTIPRT